MKTQPRYSMLPWLITLSLAVAGCQDLSRPLLPAEGLRLSEAPADPAYDHEVVVGESVFIAEPQEAIPPSEAPRCPPGLAKQNRCQPGDPGDPRFARLESLTPEVLELREDGWAVGIAAGEGYVEVATLEGVDTVSVLVRERESEALPPPVILPAPAAIWRMGYYPGWVQSRMPASEIDWSALSHVAHFSILPQSDGGIDPLANGLTPARTEEVIGAARAAGVKVLLTVGSANTRTRFLGATSDENRARFIRNIIDYMQQGGYDGLDIDWEPMQQVDFPQFSAFILELAAELRELSPRPLLTAAVLQSGSYAPLFRDLQEHFDMINLMTYDMSGPWQGWVTWHNSPLYNGGERFPCCSRELPSADLLVSQFVAAGVDRQKLGIGIAFYGTEWVGGDGAPTGGVTAPRQSWTTAPTIARGEIKFWQIMETIYDPGNYRWDEVARVPYLSFDSPGSREDRFISYEDEESVQHKVRYALREEIGGVIIWELSGGYFTTRPPGSRDPLLQAIKRAYEEER